MRRVILSGSLLLLTALNLLPLDPEDGRSRRFLPGMELGPAVDSFRATDLLPGSASQQLPPKGTVARELQPVPFAASLEEAERAGRELRNPLESAEETVAAGRTVFRTFCIPCHGGEGLGDGAVVGRGFPAPPSLIASHARDLPDGRIFHVLTFGQSNMPSYATQLTRPERWQVIHFIRRLQAERESP